MTVLNDFIKVNCRLYSVNTGAAQTPHPPALSRLARWPWREGDFWAMRKGAASGSLRTGGHLVQPFTTAIKKMEVWEVKPLVSGHTQMSNGRAGVRSRVIWYLRSLPWHLFCFLSFPRFSLSTLHCSTYTSGRNGIIWIVQLVWGYMFTMDLNLFVPWLE